MRGQEIAFTDINQGLLEKFEIWLKTTYKRKRKKKKRVSERTIANHLVVIRSVFAHPRKNQVIDEKTTVSVSRAKRTSPLKKPKCQYPSKMLKAWKHRNCRTRNMNMQERFGPNGFPDYIDKPDQLSNIIVGYLRENELYPSKEHTLYSLRHIFQDRLTDVDPPECLQAELMGHKFNRQKYGKGPTLAKKLEWMNKVRLKPL